MCFLKSCYLFDEKDQSSRVRLAQCKSWSLRSFHIHKGTRVGLCFLLLLLFYYNYEWNTNAVIVEQVIKVYFLSVLYVKKNQTPWVIKTVHQAFLIWKSLWGFLVPSLHLYQESEMKCHHPWKKWLKKTIQCHRSLCLRDHRSLSDLGILVILPTTYPHDLFNTPSCLFWRGFVWELMVEYTYTDIPYTEHAVWHYPKAPKIRGCAGPLPHCILVRALRGTGLGAA